MLGRSASQGARMTRLVSALLTALFAVSLSSAAGPLEIFFIDVEGGQSTLIVTPAGESLLVDAGWDGGRDVERIAAAARAAGVTSIDYLLITHFHRDHAGGVPELVKRLPVRTFVDHDNAMPGDAGAGPIVAALAPVRSGGKHMVAKPGDRVPLRGVQVDVVSSAGATIAKPLVGSATSNTACPATAPDAAEPIENPRSTGVVLTFGRFRFVDLGDLSGRSLFALFCPSNLLGRADLYLVPHHGGSDVVYPATFAVRPRVAIMNNGETKGGAAEAFQALHASQGLEDVWQLHRSLAAGARNFADARIANLDEKTAHWIKVSANEDGSFSVTNGRTNETKVYKTKS
jgi:beta-lactamase superfamily II metal-dependent hydrolase